MIYNTKYTKMKNIAIFASGSGSNAQNIIEYFREHKFIKVTNILTNNPDALVIKRAISFSIPCLVFSREDFYNKDIVLNYLIENNIDLIVLAGFLLLIPDNIISEFPGKIINIHPALLPKYGGKGMYGDRVHKAVLDNREKETGITIHYVNKFYDEGKIIFQENCKINDDDNVESIAEKVHKLEYIHYPRVIDKLISP
jgi:phosphoribosylglycinamide formyltransferase 1